MTSETRFGITLGVALIGSFTAHLAARRKDRSQIWSVLSFFLPVLVLLLAVLPSRSAPPGRLEAAPCASCGGLVSPEAKACLHCGQPQRPATGTSLGARIAERVGTVVVAGLVAMFVWTLTQSSGDLSYALSGGTSFPSCDSAIAKESVESAIANAPLGKVAGLSIVSWKSEETVSSGSTEERCSATILMNNAQQYQSTYRFYQENGQTLVQFQLAQ